MSKDSQRSLGRSSSFALSTGCRRNFYLTATVLIPYNFFVQYSAPVSPGLFYFHLNLRSHPCPLFVCGTACPCVVSRLPTAACAALPAPPIIPTSASTTPAKNPEPAPPINSPANWPISSLESTSPPTISAPPSAASSPPSSVAISNLAPPAPSPISPRPSSKPSISPSTNTSTPLAPRIGAMPSAAPSTKTSPTATLPPPPIRNPLWWPSIPNQT